MKANELRIGNLVTFHKGIIPIEPLMIYDIHNATNKAMFYEPIPLTEEWLVNFGFEKIAEYQFIKGKYKAEETIEDGVYSFRMQFANNESWKLRYINCVHDLQNLYHALTGQELTIKTK